METNEHKLVPGESSKGELLVYQTEDGTLKLEVRLENETIWLTQQMMAELFQTTKQNIGQHLRNIFEEGELEPHSVVKKFFTTATDGKRYNTNFYNLDVIISVGYRVKSVIQNKLHFAATGMTAAELIHYRADHKQPNMGLTSWKGDEVRRTDVIIAKNYLKETEIDELNRIVVMWLDFAEDQAKRRKQVFMKDWEQRLDEFLRFNDRNVLANAGKVSKKAADIFAKQEYEKLAKRRREYKEIVGQEESIKQLSAAAKLVLQKK